MISYGLREVALYACFAGMNLAGEMEVMIMAKKTMCDLFIESLSKCKKCINNGLCLYHSTWLKRLIKIHNCKSYTEDGCEACEKGGERWR